MLRALGLSSGPSLDEKQKTSKVVEEAIQIENAFKAMDFVLDDRADEGFELLKDRDTVPISQLAYGVIEFLEATLGFEAQAMKKAHETLSLAENQNYKAKTYAERNKLKTSFVYPIGTEFAVAYAEANLLNALLMLMSESVVEGAKALLKLRRAYHTLDQISQNMERQNGVNGTASGLHNLSLVDGSTTSLASSATTATSASVSTAGGAGGAASGTG
ncbi:unnamed protein product, partial [Ambrosiozyma monospora]